MRACPRGLVRASGGYIYVDAEACDGCGTCVEACVRGAIERKNVAVSPRASTRTLSSGEVRTVVVGSRAEAKALRKAAAQAEKKQAKAPAAPKTSAPAGARGPAAPSAAAAARASATSGGAATTSRADWSLVDAVAVLAALVLAYVVREAVFASQAFELMPAAAQVAVRAVVLGALLTAELGILAFLSHRRGSTLLAAFGLTGDTKDPRDVLVSAGLVAALLVATIAFSLAWSAAMGALGWRPGEAGATGLSDLFGAGGSGLALAIAMVVLLAPFTEELVFRGVLQGVLAGRWGTWPGIVGSALLFAGSHASLWRLVPMLVLGLALGWLAASRRGLWPAIALHALYNGVLIAAAFAGS